MNLAVKILGAPAIAGVAAFMLIPELRQALFLYLAKLTISHETIR